MSSPLLRRTLTLMLAAGIAGAGWAADSSSKSSTSSSASRSGSTTARSGKGPLPDPILLDGSTLPVEKKNEQGMIGDFELPGDENVKSGKVGGQQGGQPGGQQKPGLQVDVPMPGIPLPMGGAGAAGGQQGGGLPKMPNGAQAGAGAAGQQPMGLPTPSLPGQAGGAQSGDGSSNPLGGAGDPNAKADGVQVGQLTGEGSSQDAIAAGEKPPPVAIGDSAMKINTVGTGAGVVGAQQVGVNTQQHEKGTGTGGKGSGGASGPNRTEKGRTMPAGL